MTLHGLRTAALLVASLWALAVTAEPTKGVNLMVPYPAGGPSDVVARILEKPLARELAQQVIVENLGGVGGAMAAQKVLAAAADGAYHFQGTPNELILAPLANAAVRFKSDDFRLVQMVGMAPIAFLVRKGLPVNSLDDLVALARKSAADGKALTFGSVGYGSLYHVLGAHFGHAIGAELVHVPYKGVAPLLQDLGGEVLDFAILITGAQTVGMADQGRLKILAVLAPRGKAEAVFLNVYPSVDDSKALAGKDFHFNIWTAYLVRKDTPESMVRALNKGLAAAIADPAVRTELERLGVAVAAPLATADAARAYEAQVVRFTAIARGIKLEPR